jgi:hypothetical protein
MHFKIRYINIVFLFMKLFPYPTQILQFAGTSGGMFAVHLQRRLFHAKRHQWTLIARLVPPEVIGSKDTYQKLKESQTHRKTPRKRQKGPF